jgi:hypothetical protein
MPRNNISLLTQQIALLLVISLLSSAAFAQSGRDSMKNAREVTAMSVLGQATLIEEADVDYPGNDVRLGQEGWVLTSIVITEDGRAIDPIILDSSGGVVFERALMQSLPDFRFDTSAGERSNNLLDFRHEMRKGRDAATSNFMRRTRRILTHLHNEEVEDARQHVDSAHDVGGWNLYESTMLWLMMGRVEGAEQDHAGKLENYQRGLRMGISKAIPRKDRIEMLEKIFLLQSHFNQYAAALATAEELQTQRGSERAQERIRERTEEMRRIVAEEDVMAARATVFNPCNCEEGQPLWHYTPVRRTFSFDNLSGNVERFEARCDSQRISGAVETGKTWTLAPEWGSCRVIIFGDDGARFDFLEHRQDNEDSAANQSAVARNHVLDTRNRSQ